MNGEILKIGQMSNLFGISKQTLQYYDEIGIFKPAFRKSNGYRMYNLEQSLQLASIIYFQNKGFSLEQIKEFKNNLNVRTYFENIDEQYELLEQEIIQRKEIQKAIKRKSNFIKDNMSINDTGEIWVEEKPNRFYYAIGAEDVLYIHEGFYNNPTVVLYEGKEKNLVAIFMVIKDQKINLQK